MRQQHQQRKITPQYQEYNQGDGEPSTEGAVEWEEFEIENIVGVEEKIASHAPILSKHENGYKEEGEKKKKKSKYDTPRGYSNICSFFLRMFIFNIFVY